MFLSRYLTEPEKRYWPIKLKVIYLVWAARKLRHYIKSILGTTVFTDHSSTPDILKQTILQTIFTVKSNLRLIRANKYL